MCVCVCVLAASESNGFSLEISVLSLSWWQEQRASLARGAEEQKRITAPLYSRTWVWGERPREAGQNTAPVTRFLNDFK